MRAKKVKGLPQHHTERTWPAPSLPNPSQCSSNKQGAGRPELCLEEGRSTDLDQCKGWRERGTSNSKVTQEGRVQEPGHGMAVTQGVQQGKVVVLERPAKQS